MYNYDRTENYLVIGTMYLAIILLVVPLATAVVIEILYFSATTQWFEFRLALIIGFIVSIVFVLPPTLKIFVYETEPKNISFWLDQFSKELHPRPEGIDLIPFWFKFAGEFATDDKIEIVYNVEKENPMKIDTYVGGDQKTLYFWGPIVMTLNLDHTNLSNALKIRRFGDSISKVVKELQGQLMAQLLDVIAETIGNNFTPEDVHRRTSLVVDKIIENFAVRTRLKKEYGLDILSLGLGKISFSKKIEDAREAKEAFRMKVDAARELHVNEKEKPDAKTLRQDVKLVMADSEDIKYNIDEHNVNINISGEDVSEITAAIKEIGGAIKAWKK